MRHPPLKCRTNDHGAADHLSRGFSSLLINLNVFDILFERNDDKLLTYPPCVKGYVLNASAVSESWKFQAAEKLYQDSVQSKGNKRNFSHIERLLKADATLFFLLTKAVLIQRYERISDHGN